MNHSLTILLPVKDRPKYLHRLLDYLEKERCEFQILIADGSSEKSSRYVTERFSRRAQLHITYIQFVPDENLQLLTSKLYSVSKHISSEYVVWACDDDFYDLDSLRAGVSFLQANPDYAAYAGEVIDFNVLPRFGKRSPHYGTIWITKKNRFCSGRYSQKASVQLDSAPERLKFIDSIIPIEAIHRSKVVQQSFEILNTIPIQRIMSINFVLGLVSLLYGKFFLSDKIFLLRQDNTPESAGSIAQKEATVQNLEWPIFLDEVGRIFHVDLTAVNAILRQPSEGNPYFTAVESRTRMRTRDLLTLRILKGSSLYLRLLLAKIRGVANRRGLSFALVDSSLLTNDNIPLLAKAQNAISSNPA